MLVHAPPVLCNIPKYLSASSSLFELMAGIVAYVPSLIRKILELKAGDRLLWNIDSSRKMARIKLAPRNWGQYMNGLGEDIWKGTNANDHLDSLRSDRPLK